MPRRKQHVPSWQKQEFYRPNRAKIIRDRLAELLRAEGFDPLHGLEDEFHASLTPGDLKWLAKLGITLDNIPESR